MKARTMRWLFNLWPPFLCSGIRVRSISDDWRRARVTLSCRWYNRNYIGSHYGGSLFSMADPFYMMMLIHNLPADYRVLDKAGCIEFIKIDKGTVSAEFVLNDAIVAEIIQEAATGRKVLKDFAVDIVDNQGEPVARVVKTLYIRKKN